MDKQEVRNAVDQAQRELRTRFDFKGVDAEIVFQEETISLSAPGMFDLVTSFETRKLNLGYRKANAI